MTHWGKTFKNLDWGIIAPTAIFISGLLFVAIMVLLEIRG